MTILLKLLRGSLRLKKTNPLALFWVKDTAPLETN
jgi:hypothetical protein